MRVLIADDHDLVRETLAAFLKSEGIETVDVASTLPEATACATERGSYDLVLLDYQMPGMNGLEGLGKMIEANGRKPVALLSGTASRDVAEAAIKVGAAGYVPKTLSSKSIVSAARFMAAGEVFAPLSFIQPGLDGAPGGFQLTRRETEVLRGLCDGKSNKEIARDHNLQEVTVKLHVKTLTRKLGARNRTHAAMIGRDNHLC